MIISHLFPVLRSLSALIIVSGGVSCCLFYEIRRAKLKQIGEINLRGESFTDHEGHFKHQTSSRTLASGGGFKDNLQNIRTNVFFAEMQKQLNVLSQKRDYDKVYLFAPESHINKIRSLLPLKLLKSLEFVFYGNFTKHHILKLLCMIRKQRVLLE